MQSQVFHPCHQILINVKLHLALLYGNLKPFRLLEMSQPHLERKLQCIRDVLDTLSKIGKKKKRYKTYWRKNSFETFLRRYWLFIIKRKITKWTHQDQSLHGPKGLYEGQNYQGPIRRSIDPTKGQVKLFDISPKFVFERVENCENLWINLAHYVITYCPSSILQSLNQNLN